MFFLKGTMDSVVGFEDTGTETVYRRLVPQTKHPSGWVWGRVGLHS